MPIEVIAVAAGLLGLLLLTVASMRGPRERRRPPERDGAFIPGLYHFDGDDDGPHHS
jgi:hypothetical protein